MKDQDIHPWLRRMIQGDSDAFTQIYRMTRDHVYRTVRFLIGHKEDAADVVSEIYIQLYRSLPAYNFEQPFRFWLNGLIIRQSNNWKRKLWRSLRLFDRSKLAVETPAPNLSEERYVANEQRNELLDLVNQLPYRLREVIVLRHYQECSFEEIASTLNIPIGTVKSRHHNAIRKLRQLSGHQLIPKEASLHVD
ncbi:sigma-70 family RNA polymerase sigma factor [Paenibacillus tarimensis]